MNEPSKRLFFGLSATHLAKPLQACQRHWKLAATPVAAGNFHLTLLFLGQVAIGRLPELCAEAAKLHGDPIHLALDQAGFFPRAKVAWLGTENPPAALLVLAEDLKAMARRLALPVETRPFHTHLTLFRKAHRLPDTPWLPKLELVTDTFHLYESCSTNHGVEYQILASFRLQGDAPAPSASSHP